MVRMAFSPAGLYASTMIFTVVQVTMVGLRIWTRRKDRIPYGLDDLTVVLASVAFILTDTVPLLMLAHEGAGNKGPLGFDTLSPAFMKAATVLVTFSMIPIGFARLSVLLLYRRIFPIGRVLRFAIHAVIAYTIAWLIAYLVVFICRCEPYSVINKTEGFCLNTSQAIVSLCFTGLINDLLILFLPWPVIQKLQIRTQQKVAIGGVLLLGNLTIACSIARLVYIYAWFGGDELPPDQYFSNAVNGFWGSFEAAMAICCSCAITMGRYVRNSRVTTKAMSFIQSIRVSGGKRSRQSVGSEDTAIKPGISTASSNFRFTHPEGTHTVKAWCPPADDLHLVHSQDDAWGISVKRAIDIELGSMSDQSHRQRSEETINN